MSSPAGLVRFEPKANSPEAHSHMAGNGVQVFGSQAFNG